MTPAKRNLHALAEKLGLMVVDMKRMPLEEFYSWLEYYTVKHEPADDSEVSSDADIMAAFGVMG